MFSTTKNICSKVLNIPRYFSNIQTDPLNYIKVTVIGAAGKMGQPLCILLKQSSLIDELCLHDIVDIKGLSLDLSQIETKCKVTPVEDKENLSDALEDSKIVVVLASVSQSQGNVFKPNASIVKKIVKKVAKVCPKAILAVATSPINSIIPMACEILKNHKVFNPKLIFGITALDAVTTNSLVARIKGLSPENVMVPVIGGHSEKTSLPVLSNAIPSCEFSNEEVENIIMKVREIHKSAPLTDGSSLSGAFASARFVLSLVKAMLNYPNVIECAYVPSDCHPMVPYLCTPLKLGPPGSYKNLGIPRLSCYEMKLFNALLPILSADIWLGKSYVQKTEATLSQSKGRSMRMNG